MTRFFQSAVLASLLLAGAAAQQPKETWTKQEKPIVQQVRGLRQLPDDQRARATRELALEIRRLPVTPTKATLANNLAFLSTEGDFGRDTLQEVATTLADALRERPVQASPGEPASPYVTLAQLARYEHMRVSLKDPQYLAALAKLEADDQRRQTADFTLTDLAGKKWTLRELRGKVVLVNFWATWCPPCRKEIPDLEALYERFKDQGLVVLAISDEERGKVEPFMAERKVTYPVLLDPRRAVHQRFEVEGIPKTFIYDRQGKLAAQSIDMRTRKQFLELLAQAGLK